MGPSSALIIRRRRRSARLGVHSAQHVNPRAFAVSLLGVGFVEQRPSRGRGGNRSSESRQEGLIHIASIDWYLHRQRHQQLTERLARKRRTLVVEGMTDIGSAIRRGRFFRRLSDNLWLLSPFKFVPFESKSRFVKKLNRILFTTCVKMAAWRNGIEDPILYFTTYDDHEIPARVPHSLVVYDCHDRHESFGWASGKEVELERRLLQQADLVVASSQSLVKKLAETGTAAVLVRNAADVEFFKTARQPGDIFPGIAQLTRPRIGFVGYMADWVDLDLLDFVARSRPNWNIVLAGKRNVRDHPLFRRPNVTSLGAVPYDQLPSLLRGLDLCTIPFKIGPLTDAADTIKLFEYLSAGKQVVSTAFEQAREFSNLLLVTKTPEEFLQGIDTTLASTKPPPFHEIDEILNQHDWEVRARMLEELIENALRRKRAEPHQERLS